MVLHDLVPRPGMNVFGIQIPITGSNTQRSLEHLLAQSDLAATRDAWLVEEELHPLRRELIELVHHPDYVERLMTGDEAGFLIHREPTSAELEVMRAFELANADGSYHRFDPTTAEKTLFQLRDQSLRLARGSIRGAEIALDSEDRFCFYFGGGMHHGQHDFGEGFCLVNDLVIAVRAMQSQGRIRTAWIIDVDAHKGDGTAALTAEDDTIHTLSIHMAHGWPMDQPTTLADGRANPSFVPSDIDIPIASGEEDTYLPQLIDGIAELERRFPLPDFVVVVNGADPYERDQLPSAELLKMSREQLLERDRVVYRWIRDRDLPSLFVMAGNYGSNSWEIYSQFLERQIRGQLD